MINFIIEVDNKTLLKVSAKGKASWGTSKGFIGFTCNLLKTAVKYSIQNCLFTVEKMMLRKYIGIAMGI